VTPKMRDEQQQLSPSSRVGNVLETLHRIGSGVRHSRFLEDQRWLWPKIEPHLRNAFEWLSRKLGSPVRFNEDMLRLERAVASHYGRSNLRRYEARVYQAFIQRIEKGMRVFDIGAHIGLFTLAAAKRVGNEGRVYAFEPSTEAAEILNHHIRLNGWQDRVEVVRAVVCDVDGVVPFYVEGLSVAASLGRENIEAPLKVETPSVTLDRFCKVRSIKPDVLKVDVEGAELLVLRGARDLLMTENLSIFCEIHPGRMQYCQSSLAELDAFLGNIGYCREPLDEPNEWGVFHCFIGRCETAR